MPDKLFNARGLACPEPVIIAKKALIENPDGIIILVDNVVAKENISRFCSNHGYNIITEEQNDNYKLKISKNE